MERWYLFNGTPYLIRSGKSGWNEGNDSGVDPTSGGLQRKKTHVRDVMASEGNQAALDFDGLDSSLRSVSACSNERFLSPNIPKEFV